MVRGEDPRRGRRNRRRPAGVPGERSGPRGRNRKRLRWHGLSKKVGQTYKYGLTELVHRPFN